MKKVAKTLRRHRELILNWFRAEGVISAGIVEGLNNKAKLTMRKAYGFRTYEAIEIALYHTLGNLPEPHFTHEFCRRSPLQGGLHMLVLSRKSGERVFAGEDIEVVVLEVDGDRVMLGFNAPRCVPICRAEIHRELADFLAGDVDAEFSQ
jgi:carbon storage regulator CsrA